MAHADWLLRDPEKTYCLPGPVRGQYVYSGPVSFVGNICELTESEIKRGLDKFVGKVRTITSPRTLVYLYATQMNT